MQHWGSPRDLVGEGEMTEEEDGEMEAGRLTVLRRGMWELRYLSQKGLVVTRSLEEVESWIKDELEKTDRLEEVGRVDVGVVGSVNVGQGEVVMEGRIACVRVKIEEKMFRKIDNIIMQLNLVPMSLV